MIFFAERVYVYMIDDKMFALINIVIYRKCEQYLLRAYTQRQQSIVTPLKI